jgi:hypothetical protein
VLFYAVFLAGSGYAAQGRHLLPFGVVVPLWRQISFSGIENASLRASSARRPSRSPSSWRVFRRQPGTATHVVRPWV